MEMIMFQGGCGQSFRMSIEIDQDDPRNKRKISIESLELRTSGAFVDISGLIEICGDDLLKLRQVDYAMERAYQEAHGEPDDSAMNRALFDRTEAAAINAEIRK